MSQTHYLERTFTLLKPVADHRQVTETMSRQSSMEIEPKGDTFTQEEKEAPSDVLYRFESRRA